MRTPAETPRRLVTFERLALAVFAANCAAAFAHSLARPAAWILVLVCLASPFLQIRRLPQALAAAARFLAWGLLTGAVILGLVLMAYPILSQQTTTRLVLLGGYSLAVLAVGFLCGREIWPAHSALIPAASGVLLLASLSPSAPVQANVVIGGAALFAWLVLPHAQSSRAVQRRPWDIQQVTILTSIAVSTFLAAWGIIRLLPWAQSKVEQVTFQRYMAGATHYSMFSPDSRLGDIARLKLSKKVVMRVWSDRPQKLRGRVFTIFNGREWRAESAGLVKARVLAALPDFLGEKEDLASWLDQAPGNLYLLPGHSAEEIAAHDSIRTRVLQSGFNEGMVLLPGQTSLLRIRGGSLEADEQGELHPPLLSGSEIYAVINRRDGEVVDARPPSPQLMKECLDVPPDTDGRVRELAAQLAPGAAPPETRIRRTFDYLGRECHYSLDVGAFHSQQPVAEFLFEKKRGYCQYFASAAALLLRLEGVPCRYVTGFNVQEGNRQGDHFVVREMDAHAWIEAYLPGRGWLELDPTPDAEYKSLHASLAGGWRADTSERLAALTAEMAIRMGAMSWTSVLRAVWEKTLAIIHWLVVDSPLRSLIFLAFLLFAAEFVRRNRPSGRRRPPLSPVRQAEGVPVELNELIHQIDRLCAESGHARPASLAPLEHLAGIPSSALSPPVVEACRKIVGCFYRSYFGGSAVPPGEIQGLRRELERARAP